MAGLKEECGIVGIAGDQEAANLVYLGLYALQHRGQEASGIVTVNREGLFHSHKAFGLVGDIFNKDSLDSLKGRLGIGHNRYSTAGGRSMQNIQPFSFTSAMGSLAIAHNGNLTNAQKIRVSLEKEGSIFQSSSDTEVFMHLLAKEPGKLLLERIRNVMEVVQGAYSLLLLTPDRMFAIRDPLGFRPLVLGKKEDTTVVASETCALDLIDAEFDREVNPGEIVEIFPDGRSISHPSSVNPPKKAFCSFEPIYFARPDSIIQDEQIYELRKKMGAILARETHVDADIVIAVPDSGVPMALGYANEVGLPLELGLVRNHYVGRTFIEPSQSIRDFGVKLKLNAVRSVLQDRRVIVVDDSLVRGTTSGKILRMIRQAGAKEVHMRLSSPPITHSCYFGVDTPKRSQLLAAQSHIQEIMDFIGADTLGFLSPTGLKQALGSSNCNDYCYGCFTGDYPQDCGQEITTQPTDQNGPGLIAGTDNYSLSSGGNSKIK